MQDNASGHAIKAIIETLTRMCIRPIFWPAKSPDLNLIETLWDKMKDQIQEKYPQIHRSYLKLKAAVIKAWNSVTYGFIEELIQSMPARCKAVIDAGGWHTKYQLG